MNGKNKTLSRLLFKALFWAENFVLLSWTSGYMKSWIKFLYLKIKLSSFLNSSIYMQLIMIDHSKNSFLNVILKEFLIITITTTTIK